MNSNNNPNNLANTKEKSCCDGDDSGWTIFDYIRLIFCCTVTSSVRCTVDEDFTQKKVLNDVSIAFFEDEHPDDGIWRLRPVDSDGNAGPLKGGKGKI